MKLLKCKICKGEIEIIGSEHSINKKIKCTKCGFNNLKEPQNVMPEVIVVRKRPIKLD